MKRLFRKTQPTPNDRLATIWAIVEARSTLPAMIVIASATDDDDTTSIARGLADVAGNAGQTTGYLRINAGGRPNTGPAPYTELSISPRGSSREAFDEALTTWRSIYDVIVVDVTNLGSEPLGAHAARVADGVVVAICSQRRAVAADGELSTLLAELQAVVIGAVLAAPRSVNPPVRVTRERPRFEPAAQS